jgi:colicin import membrane protein
MTFRLPHLIAALLLHVVLLALLVGGVQCSAKPQPAPVINAVLLDPSRNEVAQQKKREQERRAEAERKRLEEARRKKLAEQKQQQEAEQQRKAAAAAAQKKEEDARRQKLAADKKAAEQKAAEQKKATEQKKAAEQKKAEDAARLKKEQEAQRQREAAAKQEAAEQARLAEAMRTEESQRELAREAAARAASERETRVAQWADALTRHIARNWVRPPGAGEEFECRLRIQMLPDGTVSSAKIVQSCGNALLDKSVEDAVFRASPLPKPSDPAVFDRDLDIRFIPQ